MNDENQSYGEARDIYISYCGSVFGMAHDNVWEKYKSFSVPWHLEREWDRLVANKLLIELSSMGSLGNAMARLCRFMQDSPRCVNLDEILTAFDAGCLKADSFDVAAAFEMLTKLVRFIILEGHLSGDKLKETLIRINNMYSREASRPFTISEHNHNFACLRGGGDGDLASQRMREVKSFLAERLSE